MYSRIDRIAPETPDKLNLVADLLLVFGVLALCEITRYRELLTAGGVGAITWLVLAVGFRLYSPATPRRIQDTITLGGVGVIGTSAAVWLTLTAFPDAASFRVLPFALFLFCSGALVRLVAVRYSATHVGPPVETVLILGTGPLAVATHAQLTQWQKPPQRVIGCLRFDGEPGTVDATDLLVLGEARNLRNVLRIGVLCRDAINEVYISGDVASQAAEMQSAVDLCEEVGLPFALPQHYLKFKRASLLPEAAGAQDRYLHYLSTPPRPAHYAIKRLMDIAASALALVVLALPLLLVSLLVKLTSTGPVLFRQRRVGLHGSMFEMLKFRSMVVDAEKRKDELEGQNEQSGPAFKMKHDPRVTAIGRFIRKFSIDELPQLVNILRGDMTIVGPRPAIPREVSQYTAWQRRRLSVRPGLTCYWQVSGRNEIGFEEWMNLDLKYVDNWRISVDIKLILKTIPVVLFGRGAS